MGKKFSILYAEDDESVRRNYIIYLESYFDKIYEARNGKEAFETYQREKPNVILMDINMPGMNGLEVIKQIREVDNETAIIILSGHSDKEFLLEAIKLNLVEYLIKPISRNEFKCVIEKILEKYVEKQNENTESEIITLIKSCRWDNTKKIFFHRRKIIDLTRKEKILFELFINNKNIIIKPSEISKCVWNSEIDANDASIRNLVKRLRKKLPIDIIQSIYGSGYILSY